MFVLPWRLTADGLAAAQRRAGDEQY
jgi:hypothetical protein